MEYEGELKEACPVDWREREEQFIKKADELASSGGHVLDWTRIRWSRWDEPYVIQGWCKSCKTVARMGRADGKVYSWPTSESCTVRIQDTQAVVAKQKRQEANEKSLTLSVVVGIGVVALVITALLVASEGAGMTLLFPFVVGAVIWLGFMLYGSLKGARETAGRYAKGPISFVILFVLFFLAILLVVLIISVLSPDLANSGAPIH
ncbi:MAG: hypothetical protein IH984_14805 [Planctomycetes bacterium]|nr:hypothetical protein [Planctomycetota bacterium]